MSRTIVYRDSYNTLKEKFLIIVIYYTYIDHMRGFIKLIKTIKQLKS